MNFRRIAVMGAGAVGCYFGGMLARAGLPVALIARGAHGEALRREGLFLESVKFQERIRVEASTEPAAIAGADLVLFCVKTLDTAAAARAIAPHLSRNATLVSLQNGVENVEEIRAATQDMPGGPIEALASVVYVAAALPKPGHIKHSGGGRLVLGDPARQDEVKRIAGCFEQAGVPCKVTDNLAGELWAKLVLNCAGNAVTAIARTGYGPAARNPHTREVMAEATRECVAVARAAGIALPPGDLVEHGLRFAEGVGEATSSTAQDIARGKRTEIDVLNGYVARRGAELSVPTPVNHTLFALVRLLEEQPAN